MATSPGNEYREETRIEQEETIFIEVLSSEENNDVIMCTSLDLSANGLQVVVDNDIPIGSILRLCIDLPDKDPIFLVGEVMWKRPDPDSDSIRLGFLLFESDDSNIEEWKLWMADALT
ncbi:MAG: hypothetical protein ACI9FB_003350 [Candidatus Azotimanducaceae bacterium]|jgi:hypothetical protein